MVNLTGMEMQVHLDLAGLDKRKNQPIKKTSALVLFTIFYQCQVIRDLESRLFFLLII